MVEETEFYRNLREAAPVFVRFAELTDEESASEHIVAAKDLGDVPEGIQPRKGRRMDVTTLNNQGIFCSKREYRKKWYYLMVADAGHLGNLESYGSQVTW